MAAKFQQQPPREQKFLEGDKISEPFYKWFNLIPPRLTSPAVASTPATSGANGIAGQLFYDQNFLYICVATNKWKRIALSAF